ncbi:MAG TPA: hypothetical protein IAB01_08090 [Candidatus Avidesulfovibrio excrementigallinarum]|nr:hypothetical protein [Candidatus Avidesulfovibrio excrementigallinarum]
MVRLFLCALCSIFFFVQNASCDILQAQKYRSWTSFVLTDQPGYAAMSTTAADHSTLMLLISDQDAIVRILSPAISTQKAARFDYHESTRVKGTVRIDSGADYEALFNIRRVEANRIALEIEGRATEQFLEEAMGGRTIRLRVNASNELRLRLSYSLSGFTYAYKRCLQLLSGESETPGNRYFDTPDQGSDPFQHGAPSDNPGEILSL